MRIELPILVESRRVPDDGVVYSAGPLFFSRPRETDRQLNKATSKLAASLNKHLGQLGRNGQHRQLADYTFCPDVLLHRLELALDIPGSFVRAWFPVATFRHMGKHLAFSPYLSEVWFEVPEGQRLTAHAQSVYTRHFRKVKKEHGDGELQRALGPFLEKTKQWLSLIQLNVSTRREYATPQEEWFALLGGGQAVSGAEELERVGRSLDRLYPDQLERAFLRDGLVDELERLLEADDRRPVMLVGPPMVGKTSLVHELVYRRVQRRRSPYTAKENVWLLAPQRLISGMSYVGQWENRVLAILKTARKRNHILYFEDVLGLCRAGITSQSNLSVADVLKPFAERREIRILAEMTPEALRVFRERDRGFADQFHLIPVEEPDHRQTLRILMAAVRRLERQHRVRFGLETLPAILELTRRYQRQSAYPGKAARSLGQLAVKFQGRDVDRGTVLGEFHAKSGLEVTFLDARARLPRREVVQALSRAVIGQPEAVDAMTDVVSIAKARLNDPSRPLGTLFFLGPTGVGKTQSAKALAAYLFGDAARLLRFDMNEFVSPRSAARLVGTFDQPEGLLTSAIRRQPFAVVLFDEIEKAHADVMDLLLQILGEARLTDALGRTTDFSSAIVILTSNLGTQEASREVGFGHGDEVAEAVYLKAVREFLRPELFNRLDRIVPFLRLDRSELAEIARSVIAEVTGREGLVRRKCAVDIAGDAVDWVIERGFHRSLGARAMRRAVEREMMRPVAVQLAAIPPDRPTVLSVARRGENLVVKGTGLTNVARLPSAARPARLDNVEDLLARAQAAIDRVQTQCARHRPQGDLVAGALPRQYEWYLGATELLRDIQGLADQITQSSRRPHRSSLPISVRPKGFRRHRQYGQRRRPLEAPGRELWRELVSANDVFEYLAGLASEQAEEADSDETEQQRYLLDKLALLEIIGPDEQGWRPERAAVMIRSVDDDVDARDTLAQFLERKFLFQAGFVWRDRVGGGDEAMTFGLEARRFKSAAQSGQDRVWWEAIPDAALGSAYRERLHVDVLVFEGHRAGRFLQLEHGTHLFTAEGGQVNPIQAVVMPMGQEQDLGTMLAESLQRHDRTLEEAQPEEPLRTEDPFTWLPVVGAYVRARGLMVDLRTGLTASGDQALSPTVALMAALPLPQEMNQ